MTLWIAIPDGDDLGDDEHSAHFGSIGRFIPSLDRDPFVLCTILLTRDCFPSEAPLGVFVCVTTGRDGPELYLCVRWISRPCEPSGLELAVDPQISLECSPSE